MEWTPPPNGMDVPTWRVLRKPPELNGSAHCESYDHRHRSGENVVQIHGVNEHGKATLRKQLKRDQMASFFATLAPAS